jgi:predicted RNase H-like nuclease (RuvC/YqgF family)
MSRPCENCQTLAELNSNQAKTIAELQAKVKELEKEVRHLETSVASSEEVEKELQAENKLLHNVAGNYMQTISNLQAELAYAYKGVAMRGRR